MLASLPCPERGTPTNLICTSGAQQADWSAHYPLYARERVSERTLFDTVRTAEQQALPEDHPLVVSLDDTLVGKGASDLHGYALGHDPRPVICEPPEAKSYGEQETFNADTTDEAFILARLRAMADSLMRRVRNDRKSIRSVTLRLRYNSNTLEVPTALENDVYPLLTGLLKRAWERRESVRLVGLKFSKVYEAGLLSVVPLEPADMVRCQWHKLAGVVDALQHGGHSVMRGHDLG
ncbi:DinB/UmuC family translesion DNA polymerase [Prosthecobacter vanneervenii]|uniref:DNA polymerase Y-family little finger domain-containing protein n=1 Tax=Prosthecobacter vanneervenii TaxID=48466 RepID=A0A7W8DJ68_9BACT|nr:hypothetical protein [Prosthecobacter vanneervenii]MBB5031536.1 hypothetical protein [Prosthecobacter vanneervenii]